MSTKLGTLTLDLVAKVTNFTDGIKTAEKQTATSFGKMKEVVSGYSGAVALAASTAVAAVGSMAITYANTAAEIQNFSAISMSSTTEFQRQAAGAKSVGLNMDQLANQYKDFNEKLGEFLTVGSGGAVDFFEQIAIETEGSAEGARQLAIEMQKLSGPQAMQLYVDKLEEAGVSQQQMSFYLESMASDTTNLIPLLRNGGEGFKFWADAAQDAGLIMDEHAIKKAAELKVQMNLLDMQVQGAKNQFIQGFMPAIVSVGRAVFDTSGKTNLMSDAGATLGNVFKGVGAIALGVYASVKMLSNAIAGLAVDAVKAKDIVDSASESGSIFNRLPAVKAARTLILGSVLTQAPDSGWKMAAQDNKEVAEDIAQSITTIFSSAVDAAVENMAELQNAQAGVIAGSKEWVEKQNEAAAATAKTANNALEQLERERAQIRSRYAMEFADDDWKRVLEYQNQVADLQKAFTGAELQNYLDVAKTRYEQNQKLATMQFEWELTEHLLTEEQKLRYSYNIKEQEIKASNQITNEQKKLKFEVLKEQFDQEFGMFKLSQEKQLLEMKRNWMTAGEYARQYYALVRQEILNTPSYSPEMKHGLVKEANFNQGMEENSEREGIWGDYQSRFEPKESPYQSDVELLQSARDQMLITEEEFQQKRLALQTAYGAQYGGEFAGMLMGLVDQSSSAYALLGSIQKGAALFSTAMNSYTAISAAWASAPFPYNLPAVGMATMETGLLQAAVSALSPTVGMAHDGIDNVPKEGTWLLDKGERVVDSRTNADLKGYLQDARSQSSGPNITINVPPGYTAHQTESNDGITVDIVDRMTAQNLADPNSQTSKAYRRQYATSWR